MSDKSDNVVHVDFRNRAAASEPEADSGGLESGEASKLESFAGMVEHGMVMVMFDTRAPGVDVPRNCCGTPQLHLNFSHRFRLPDFEYDEDGIRGTLSFDEGDHRCVIPWDAVYGLSSQTLDERLAYPESFPPELLALLPEIAGPGPEDDDPT